MTSSGLAREAGHAFGEESPLLQSAGDDVPFRVEMRRVSDAAALLRCLDGLEANVSQSPLWLECWLSVFGRANGIEPFVILLRDTTAQIRLALPLVRREENGLKFLEAMDLGVSDYIAPLIRREGHEELPSAETLWRLIGKVLPEADVLRLERMAPVVAGMANPLFQHPRARLNRLAGWAAPECGNWEEFFAGLSPKQKDNSGKNRRRFLRQPGAAIHIVREPDEGLAMLDRLDAFQKGRIGDKGLDYCLDRSDIAAFYRMLTVRGIGSGQVLIAQMRAGEEIVAVNFAVLAGREALYLRVGNQFGEWGKMSPGVMVTELAIEEAFRRGIRVFDFGMGDYVYKRRLGAQAFPLRDLVLPLSLRGAPFALLWHARSWASRNPFVRRLTGRAVLSGGDSAVEGAAA